MLAEYGVVSAPATPEPRQPIAIQTAKMPAALMHQSVQGFCDQKARVFAWIRRLKFNFRANDKNMKLAVLNLAAKHARPLRTRAISRAPALPNKYRVNNSADLFKVLDYIYGAYIPDKNGNLKFQNYFDVVGNFRFQSAKVAKQLKIPIRTFQRVLARLTALRLIDCRQKATQNDAGDYRGSGTWVTARADIYWMYLKEVEIQKSFTKAGRIPPETPTEILLGVPGVATTESRQIQPEKPVDSEPNGNDNIVISYISIMETPSVVPEAPDLDLPLSKKIYSRAGAPGALPPENSICVSGLSQQSSSPVGLPGDLSSVPAILTPKVVTGNQPQPGSLVKHQAAVAATNYDIPVAPIAPPTTALEVGCHILQQITRRIAEAFPEVELKLSHCAQIRSWMMRSTPLERMTFEDLDGILDDYSGGYKHLNAAGESCRLTLDWLLAAWPKLLKAYKHDQLRIQGADAAEHRIEMMSARAEAEFDAGVKHEINAINDIVAREGSDASYDPCFLIPRGRMIFSLIAFRELGLTARINELITDPWRLERLQSALKEAPVSALLARSAYPDLFALCSLEKSEWAAMKAQVKSDYQEKLLLKTEAEQWGLESNHNFGTLT